MALAFAFALLAAQPFEARAQAPAERGFEAGEGPNGPVTAVAVQPDGKILIIGAFNYAGQHNGIARLNADGSFDASFGASADGTVWAVRVQSDGRILVGGSFQHMNGWLSPGLVRLNPDGSVDRTFEPRVNGTVCSVVETADGRIVIGGFFSEVGGQRRFSVARLNRGGSLDETFDPGWGPDSYVFALAAQPDGRVVLGGMFRWVNGQPRDHVARLNADGSLDAGFNPGADRPVRAVAVQRDGRIILGGEFFYVARQQSYYITRLNADGSPDMGFYNRGTNGEVRAIALQPDGRIIIGGNFLQTDVEWRSYVARLNEYGQVDRTFFTRANGAVNAVFVQPDGRVVVGGEFTEVGGLPRKRIARLKADGSVDLPGPLDSSFVVPGLSAADVVAVQPDGRILVAGIFERGSAWDVVRVHPDGTLDAGFNVSTDPGHHGAVVTMSVQADGRILIGGFFSQVNGRPRHGLARLNPDGTLDESFVADTGYGEQVYAVYALPDGRALVGGSFSTINGRPSRFLARLNADGSLDTSFVHSVANAGPYSFAHQEGGKVLIASPSLDRGLTDVARLNPDGSFDRTFNANVQGLTRSMVVQPDGRILVGGSLYLAVDGRLVRINLCRLNPDGSLDHTFQGTASDDVNALALQTDGRVLVGGSFTSVNGYPQGYLARLNADGTLDLSFKPGVDHNVYNVVLQADGRVLVGGSFSRLGGEPHEGFGRLKNTAVARQTLTLDAEGETVNWSRTGTGPEVGRVTFEYTDGEGGFRELGAGVRHAGGWHLSGLGLPAGRTVTIRARGFYQSGAYWEASSTVETVGTFDVPAARP